MKRLLLTTLAAVCLVVGTVNSQAGFIPISVWAATPQSDGNTLWTLVSTDLPAGTEVSFNPATGFRIQTTYGSLAGGTAGMTWHLVYTAQMLTSGAFFKDVSVDSSLAGSGSATVSKVVTTLLGTPLTTPSTVTSVNGVPSGASPFSSLVASIKVTETITAGIGTTISSFDNTYTVVPEPTTVLAGSLLLLPFAASTIRRIRKNKA